MPHCRPTTQRILLVLVLLPLISCGIRGRNAQSSSNNTSQTSGSGSNTSKPARLQSQESEDLTVSFKGPALASGRHSLSLRAWQKTLATCDKPHICLEVVHQEAQKLETPARHVLCSWISSTWSSLDLRTRDPALSLERAGALVLIDPEPAKEPKDCTERARTLAGLSPLIAEGKAWPLFLW